MITDQDQGRILGIKHSYSLGAIREKTTTEQSRRIVYGCFCSASTIADAYDTITHTHTDNPQQQAYKRSMGDTVRNSALMTEKVVSLSFWLASFWALPVNSQP